MERGEGKNMRIMTTFKKPTLESLTPPFPRPLFLARGGFFGVKKLEKERVLRE